MSQTVLTIFKKIMQLNEQHLAEVDRFVDSLRLGEAARLTQISMAVSEPVFDRVWNNREDEVYDSL